MRKIDENSTAIDLSTIPLKIDEPVTQFTVGDLHANAIKLIYTLVRYGVCKLDDKTYKTLIELYNSPAPQTKENIKKWESLINDRLTIPENGKNTLVRLIGDVLADRGANDWFVLTVLKKLSTNGVQIRTLMSNHDNEFIQAFLQADKAFLPDGTPLVAGQSKSYENFKKCIVNESIDYGIAKEIVNQPYLNTLFLVDYSVDKEGHLTLFTHAPADLDAIRKVAEYFGVDYKDDSTAEIIQTLDAINQEFRFITQSGHLKDATEAGSELYKFFWRREGNLLANDDTKKENEMIVSEGRLRDPRGKEKNEGITFVHGHSKSDRFDNHISTNVHRIDNQLGKDGLLNSNYTRDVAFISDDPISPIPEFDHTIERNNKRYLVSIQEKQQVKLERNVSQLRELIVKTKALIFAEHKKDPNSLKKFELMRRQDKLSNELLDISNEIDKLEKQRKIDVIQNKLTTLQNEMIETEKKLVEATRSLNESKKIDPDSKNTITQKKEIIKTNLENELVVSQQSLTQCHIDLDELVPSNKKSLQVQLEESVESLRELTSDDNAQLPIIDMLVDVANRVQDIAQTNSDPAIIQETVAYVENVREIFEDAHNNALPPEKKWYQSVYDCLTAIINALITLCHSMMRSALLNQRFRFW